MASGADNAYLSASVSSIRFHYAPRYINAVLLLLLLLFFIFFYTPGSKGFRGLKTKVKNKAGMAIGPVDPWKTSRAKAPS